MKRQVLTFGFLIIIASMIFGSVPNYVLADSQSDTMIRIAQQAHVQLKMQLSKAEVSDELRELFAKGSKHLELLIQSSEEDNMPEARKHFLATMEIFREVSHKMTEQPTQEASVSAAQVRPSVSNEIERLESYIDRLEAISIKNKIDVDFSTAYGLIKEAKNAETSELDAIIADIKKAIIELQNTIKEKTSSSTTEKAKTFAKRYLTELDRLIVQANEIGVSETTLEKLESAKTKLHDAEDVQAIITEVKKIISVKADFEAQKGERVNSRINQLETKFERLDYAEKDDSYHNAERMISELKQLVSEGKLAEAIDMINSLNKLLQEMETKQPEIQETEIKQPEPQENLSAQKEDGSTSLDESKIDRIKTTIVKLEKQLQDLKGKIGDNAAAERWLNNAISQLENAKSNVEESPEQALEIIKKVEQILKRVQNISQ